MLISGFPFFWQELKNEDENAKRKSKKSGRKSHLKWGMQDTIIKSKFFEKIFDEELKYVMRERLSKRQCKMSVCIYKLSCPACAN